MKKVKIVEIIKGMLFAFAVAILLTTGSLNAKAGSLNEAVDISSGAPARGMITDSDKEQYFQYIAGASGYVSFSVSPSELTTDKPSWDVELYTSDAAKVDRIYGTNTETNKVMVVAGTKYYIKITNDYGSRDVAYNIKANFVSYPSVVAEPNSGASNAKAVAFNNEYLGVIDYSDDEDFFKITAPKSGDVVIDFKRYQITSTDMPEWDFTVYDSSMNKLYGVNSKFQDDVHNTENIHYVLSAKHSIYVKINRSNSYAVGELYSFKTTFKPYKFVEKESNNDFNKATNINVKNTCVGVMGEDSTGDYYRVKTKGSGKYKVSMKLGKSVKYGYSIKVYDSSRKLVAQTSKKIYKKGSVTFKGKKNKKYYVVIEHADKGFLFGGGITVGTDYKLKVSK